MANHIKDDEEDKSQDGYGPVSFRAPIEWIERIDEAGSRYGLSRAEEIINSTSSGLAFRMQLDKVKVRLFDFAMSKGISVQEAVALLVEKSLDQLDRHRESSRKKGKRT